MIWPNQGRNTSLWSPETVFGVEKWFELTLRHDPVPDGPYYQQPATTLQDVDGLFGVLGVASAPSGLIQPSPSSSSQAWWG